MPLLFVPGPAGKFFRNLPLVVIAVLAISLIESLFVLPAHLAERKHIVTTVLASPFVMIDVAWKRLFGRGLVEMITSRQQAFSTHFEWFVEHVYGRVIAVVGRWRWRGRS